MGLESHVAGVLVPTDEARIVRLLDEQHRAVVQDIRADQVFDRVDQGRVVHDLIQASEVQMGVVPGRSDKGLGPSRLGLLEPGAQALSFRLGEDIDRRKLRPRSARSCCGPLADRRPGHRGGP